MRRSPLDSCDHADHTPIFWEMTQEQFGGEAVEKDWDVWFMTKGSCCQGPCPIDVQNDKERRQKQFNTSRRGIAKVNELFCFATFSCFMSTNHAPSQSFPVSKIFLVLNCPSTLTLLPSLKNSLGTSYKAICWRFWGWFGWLANLRMSWIIAVHLTLKSQVNGRCPFLKKKRPDVRRELCRGDRKMKTRYGVMIPFWKMCSMF